jgi:hypothetical protein
MTSSHPLCPTCKSDRWLEVYPSASSSNGLTVYCRHCEEGCVPPLFDSSMSSSSPSPTPKSYPSVFDGSTLVHHRDNSRLARQLERVRTIMSDGQWRTLEDLSVLTSDPEASVSARLRDLRKPRFGGLTVERKYVRRGLFVYRVSGVAS